MRVAADQYAHDTIILRSKVEEIYKGIEEKPLIIAPGGFLDQNWFRTFINGANNSLDVVTHHIYNLGPGKSSKKTVENLTLNSSILQNFTLCFFLCDE